MRKSLDGGPTNTHTHTQKPHVRQTEEQVEAETKAGMRREIRSDAIRCEVKYIWDEMMYICNGLLSSSYVWSSWGCTHLYVRPSPFLKSSVQLRPSCSSNSALLSGLSGLGRLAANVVESLPSPIEPFTFDFRLVAPATSSTAAATAAALLCAMPNGTFTLRQLMSTTTRTTTTKVNK